MRAENDNHELEREVLADRIEEVSAEGRPAAPTLGQRRITMLLVLAGLAFVIVGLVLGATVNWPTGLVVTVVGLAVFFLSPIFWAAVLRARERGRVRRQVRTVR